MIPDRVDQILAGFADGDAISREARDLRRILRGLGFKSEIFVPFDRTGLNVADECRPVESYDGGSPSDVVIYHYSTGSLASAVFLDASARKIVRYHNITPARFFEGFDSAIADELRNARSEAELLITRADALWAVSEFNAEELRKAGASKVSVVPLFFSLDNLAMDPDRDILRKFGGKLKNVLFVGRIAPNKCVEELILAFAWLNNIDPATRLLLVGSERSCPRYYAMLRMLADRLGLTNVVFAKFMTSAQLAACYRSADLFVCTSRHEGYCLPLIEAMSCGVPVMARSIGGMPEAMGGAGVMFDNTEPRVLAELMNRMLIDKSLREEVLNSQSGRIAEIRARDMAGELKGLLT